MEAFIEYLLMVVYFLSFFFVVFWLITFVSDPGTPKARRMARFPEVTVAVPAYNEEAHIQETLRSIINLDYPKEKLEIIIINDGSADRTKEKAEDFIRENPEYRITLLNQTNKGKGAAMNNALSKAKGDFFVCLDADSFADPDALQKIIPQFSRGKDVAAVLPCLKIRKGNNFLQKMQRYEYIVNMFYKEMMSKLDCIRVTPGPFSVYRKKVLQKLGGFDEHNLTEDLEIALRFQKNNYKIVQTMETNVTTVPPKTLKGLIRQRNRWYKGSLLNTLRYKEMIFSRKFGDFGMIEMPITLFSGTMVLAIIFSLIYHLLKPVFARIHQFNLVGFDPSAIWISIQNWFVNFHVLDLNFILISLAIIMSVASIYVLRISHLNTKEKIFKYGPIPLICYMLLYFFIIGIVWSKIFIDLALRKQQKW